LPSLRLPLPTWPVLSYWSFTAPSDVVDREAVRREAEEKERRTRLQRSSVPILRGSQNHPIITVVASVVLLGITFAMVPFMKVDFIGDTGQNMVMVSQEDRKSTRLNSSHV